MSSTQFDVQYRGAEFGQGERTIVRSFESAGSALGGELAHHPPETRSAPGGRAASSAFREGDLREGPKRVRFRAAHVTASPSEHDEQRGFFVRTPKNAG